jgi:hypothetical protein
MCMHAYGFVFSCVRTVACVHTRTHSCGYVRHVHSRRRAPPLHQGIRTRIGARTPIRIRIRICIHIRIRIRICIRDCMRMSL